QDAIMAKAGGKLPTKPVLEEAESDDEMLLGH
ncbi:MAG: hypothetical protein JWP29_2186, partial [Rhodoferax sp.]|nr:hypothetical protein [Rhodoferax sp.]